MKRLPALVSFLLLTATASVGAAAATPSSAGDEFATENAAWREWRLERLTSETGWVTLIGLDWLQPGDNLLGSAPEARLQLPADRAPARVGVLRFAEGKVTLLPEAGTGLTADGAPLGAPLVLGSDSDEHTTLLELGSLNFYLIRRGDRVGLRIRDKEARLRREFPGLDYFPADARYRVSARFTPNPPGTTVPIVNVLGITDQMPSPGRVDFELEGKHYSLTALDDTGDGRLFLIVGDRTNGDETYGGGRFLYADPPQDGATIVDFNRLYNPPCAFTPYSTCQLPPRENKLPRRLEVGEKKFAGGAH